MSCSSTQLVGVTEYDVNHYGYNYSQIDYLYNLNNRYFYDMTYIDSYGVIRYGHQHPYYIRYCREKENRYQPSHHNNTIKRNTHSTSYRNNSRTNTYIHSSDVRTNNNSTRINSTQTRRTPTTQNNNSTRTNNTYHTPTRTSRTTQPRSNERQTPLNKTNVARTQQTVRRISN